MIGIDPDCHYGDHTWDGGSICVRCGERLRCGCGRYVREDDLARHVKEDCPFTAAIMEDERRRIEATFA